MMLPMATGWSSLPMRTGRSTVPCLKWPNCIFKRCSITPSCNQRQFILRYSLTLPSIIRMLAGLFLIFMQILLKLLKTSVPFVQERKVRTKTTNHFIIRVANSSKLLIPMLREEISLKETGMEVSQFTGLSSMMRISSISIIARACFLWKIKGKTQIILNFSSRSPKWSIIMGRMLFSAK